MDEQQFISEINSIPWEQPAGNDDYRNVLLVFADWLEERGDPRSELIRLREGLLNDPTPEQRQVWEPRMQELIHNGVQPVQATWENSIGMKFCWCPPGKFTMGSPTMEERRFYNADQVDVTLTQGDWLGKYHVTQGEWKKIIGSHPWDGEGDLDEIQEMYNLMVGDNHPLSIVNWDDAVACCKKLTEHELSTDWGQDGWAYCLPTEAQWENGCRAGTKTAYCFGNDASMLPEYAWYNFARGEWYAHEVGQKRGNAWGLHDMHGNVYEWCQDWYAVELLGGSDPMGATTGSLRVCRGGRWSGGVQGCRSANRSWESPDHADGELGFRAALVPTGK